MDWVTGLASIYFACLRHAFFRLTESKLISDSRGKELGSKVIGEAGRELGGERVDRQREGRERGRGAVRLDDCVIRSAGAMERIALVQRIDDTLSRRFDSLLYYCETPFASCPVFNVLTTTVH